MWFELGVVYLAALSIADFSLFNYIGFDPKVSYVEFSVISGLWSLSFITTSEVLGRLADRGRHRSLALLSSAAIAVSALVFLISRGSTPLLGLAYVIHAFATATANLAFSTGVFELTPSDSWEYRTSVQRLSLYSIRGLALLLISMTVPLIGSSGPVMASLVAATALGISFFTILTPSLPLLERRLNRVLNGLSYLGSYSASLAALVGGRYGVIYEISTASRYRRSSPLPMAISASLAAFVGDYFLTALPLYLRSDNVSFASYSFSFGVASLVGALALALFDAFPADGWLVGSLIAARGLWMSLGLRLASADNGLTLYLVPSITLFASIDLLLYRLFMRRSSGYGVHMYAALRELGSLTGSLAGGLALMGGRAVFFGLPISASLASAGILAAA